LYKFTPDEVTDIKKLADDCLEDKYDFKGRAHLEEICASLFLIKKLLGKKWFDRAFEIKKFEEIRKSTRSQAPPISFYLVNHDGRRHEKIKTFGMYLKFLAGDSNLESKISEYVDEQNKKKKDITTNLFDSTYFELAIASFFVRNGLTVNFIKEQKNASTPDLELVLNDESSVLECKKKRYIEYKIYKILDSIENANNQLEEYGKHGIVAVELVEDADNSKFDFDELKKAIEEDIKNKQNVDFVWIVNEEYRELGDNIVQSKTRRKSVYNSNNKNELPESIKKILLYGTTDPVYSLFDD